MRFKRVPAATINYPSAYFVQIYIEMSSDCSISQPL